MPTDRPAAPPAGLPAYAELAPSPALAPWVACYWTIRATSAPPLPNRVLPDGCADLVVDCATGPRPLVVGAMRAAVLFPIATWVDLFGVRFRPGGAHAFLDVPLRELTDRRVPLASLWGRVADELADALATAPPGERAACADRALRERLRRAPRTLARGELAREEAVVARAVALLRRTHGGLPVRALAATLGAGERRLERAFDRCVGLSPKALARVLRFRHALRAIEGGSARAEGAGGARRAATPGWSALALAAGYADQAHFVREFRALAGLTPTAYAAERRAVGFVQYGDGGLG